VAQHSTPTNLFDSPPSPCLAPTFFSSLTPPTLVSQPLLGRVIHPTFQKVPLVRVPSRLSPENPSLNSPILTFNSRTKTKLPRPAHSAVDTLSVVHHTTISDQGSCSLFPDQFLLFFRVSPENSPSLLAPGFSPREVEFPLPGFDRFIFS